MAKSLFSLAAILLAGSIAHGDNQVVSNQQQFLITMGSNLGVQGAGGSASVVSGPLFINLTQQALPDSGNASGLAGITGLPAQAGVPTNSTSASIGDPGMQQGGSAGAQGGSSGSPQVGFWTIGAQSQVGIPVFSSAVGLWGVGQIVTHQ